MGAIEMLKGVLLKPSLNLLNRILKHEEANSLIIGSPLGWSWQATLDETHHGSLSGPTNAHRHSDLASIGIDDHHDRDHAARHVSGGADAVTLDASQIGTGRFGTDRLPGGALEHVLIGQGVDSDPVYADPIFVVENWPSASPPGDGKSHAAVLGQIYNDVIDRALEDGGRLQNAESAVGTIEGATTLHNKLTAARAALLDEITAARLSELDAANIPADIDGLKTSRGRQLFSMDFWSVPQLSVIIPAGAANQALPDVVVTDLPAGMTVVAAKAMFKFRSISNAGAANKLSGSQHIQIQKNGVGGYADAISLVDDQFTIAAATVDAPGDVVIGDHNVVAKVDGSATYNLQWTSANADVAGLTFNDVQMGLRIWYSV